MVTNLEVIDMEIRTFADMTLVIQVTGFIILISAVIYAKKRNLLRHFTLTRISVSLGVIAFIWMGFSFISYVPTNVSSLIIGHMIFGIPALLIGILYAFDMIEKTKIRMRFVFILWTMAIFAGVALYFHNYVT